MNRTNGTRAARSRLSAYLSYLLLPFILVGILEVVLRLTGVGYRIPLFTPSTEAGYLQPNEAVVKRLFIRPEEAPDVRIDPEFFLEDKPEGAIRIVVQGASTAAGFPFGRAASLAAMLQQRLQREFPERTVEVISAAMPATNSFALLDFADEIVDIEPDAVIIYAGHDEFLGILGVGSAFSSGLSPKLTRLVLGLRKLNLIEAGFQVYGATAPSQRPTEGALMAQMVGEKDIAYGSELFAAGHRQFRENLTLLLDIYRKRKIQVFIGTLASNEQGLAPFRPADLNMSVASSWNDAYRAFTGAAAAGDASNAVVQAGLLVKLAPDNAMSWYVQGQAELLRDRPAEARHGFIKAKDLDQLRFRAPESFNDIVRSAALEHGAILVDTQQALAMRSSDRIIGDETMLDHIHPNVDSYFYLAEAFHEAVIASGILGPPADEVETATARRAIPVTQIDRLVGNWRTQRLRRDWPFVARDQLYTPPDPRGEAERIARAWYDGRISRVEAMEQALTHYRQTGDQAEAGRVAASLAAAVPFDADYAHMAGTSLLAAGDPGWALSFLRQAVRLQPDNTVYLVSLAEGLYAADERKAALATLDRVLAIAGNHPDALALGKKIRRESGGD